MARNEGSWDTQYGNSYDRESGGFENNQPNDSYQGYQSNGYDYSYGTQGYQDYQGYQDTRGYPQNQTRHSGQRYQDGYQPAHGDQGYSGYQSQRGSQGQQSYGRQGYDDYQGYDAYQGYDGYQDYQRDFERTSSNAYAGASYAGGAAQQRGGAGNRGARQASQANSHGSRGAQSSRGAAAAVGRERSGVIGKNPYDVNYKSKLPLVIALIAILALAISGFVYFTIIHPSHYDVTINGETVDIPRESTVQSLFDSGLASTNPGDLLAIDGSVLTQGGGVPYVLEVNGSPATAETVLMKNDALSISRGADVTETTTVTQEVIPAGRSDGDRSFEAYWAGSIHLLSDGRDGMRTITTGDVSGLQTVEETTSPIPGGYIIYTANTGGDKVIALTFDDGPWPETTDAILDILEQYGAKATFFTIGSQIASYSDSVRRANDMGCQICTHTWDHAEGSGQGVNITYMSPEEQINEILMGYEAITNVTGVEPQHVVRTPGGNFYDASIDILWPYVDAEIGWDVDTEDWARPGSEAIMNAILSVQPGQVILMHDGGGDRWQTVEALQMAMPILVEQGYRFVTISELLEYGVPA